ncbi:MAG: hypothetical protein E7434_04035 [Ruminococcaceae bacterium]|nr:hypothetical protein [Oscillospiraceae bacterium]
MFEILRDGPRPVAWGTYIIADRMIELTTKFSYVHMMCYKYECEKTREPDYYIQTSFDDIEAERIKANEENKLEGLPEIEFKDNYLETTAVYRKIAEAFIDDDIFLFHGSVIAVDGEAYLFTAKSGTGKSTHTALWRDMFGERAVMVNDDKPLLEIKEDKVIVHGSPWNGKHGLGENISVPLKALCVLERGEKNMIERIDATSALPLLLQQTNRMSDPSKLMKTLGLVDKLMKLVPIYRLKCNMDPEAAKVAYEGMQTK